MAVNAAPIAQQQAELAAECLRRVKNTHGTENVWAVRRLSHPGARALKELRLPRHAESLMVVHRFPRMKLTPSMANGLQAATGAGAGKRSLAWKRQLRRQLALA